MVSPETSLYERQAPALNDTERRLYDEVSRTEPWTLVERFATLERVSGSEEERQAAEYILDRLESFSIDHRRYDPELYISVPESGELAVTDPVAESFSAVKTVAFSASTEIRAPLTVTRGTDESDDIDDLLAADVSTLDDVAGMAVLLTGLLPIEAVGKLETRGAAAIIVQHPHEREPHDGIATPVWGGAPKPSETDRIPDIPILTVARPVGERLRELAIDGECIVEVETDLTTGWRSCPVVEARIEGTGTDDSFVLLHGHYDSWHVGVTDNATGDAGLLECARVFAEHEELLHRNLRVAWWPAHSTGRYAGSTWYAEHFANDLEANCLAHVNMDSPGAAGATEFDEMVTWMPEAEELCTESIRDVTGKESSGTRPPRAGDYSFNNLGITGLFMLSSNIPEPTRNERGYHQVGGSGGNANAWHLTTDTIDKADPDVLLRDIRVYAVAIARLVCRTVPPLDYRETISRAREDLQSYAAAAGNEVDFDRAVSALERLDERLAELADGLQEGTIEPAAAVDARRRVSRRLVNLSFCEAERFEQDPAIARPPFPRLAIATEMEEMTPRERNFANVALRRELNRVQYDLTRAQAAVEEQL